MSLHYHSGKANVVVDALSRVSIGSVAHFEEEIKELTKRCSRACSIGSLPYEHIRLCYNISQWVRIFIGSKG